MPNTAHRSRLPVVAIVAALAVFGCNTPTPRSMQLDYAKSLTPQPIVAAEPRGTSPAAAAQTPSEPVVLKVRLYVDRDYQSQVLHWPVRLPRLIEKANEVLGPATNLKLVLISIEPWPTNAGKGSLDEALSALAEHDRAEDVDLVIGFVSSLTFYTASHEQLGLAHLPGRHAVIRGIENAGEANAITETFTTFDGDEKAALVTARKQHKELLLLLHELGHGLGLPHTVAPSSIMNPVYSTKQNSVGAEEVGALRVSLSHHQALGTAAGQRTAASALASYFESTDPSAWERASYTETVDHLKAVATGKPPPVQAGRSARLSEPDRLAFNAAVEHLNAGHPEKALSSLGSVPERYPTLANVQALHCQIRMATEPLADASLTACHRAAAVEEKDGLPHLLLGEVLLRRKDLPGARDALETAFKHFEAVNEANAERWAMLSSRMRAATCVTRAEQAAQKAPGRKDSTEVLEWAQRQRRWVGLPEGIAQPTGAAECEYVEAFRAAEAEFDAGRLARAEARIGYLARVYPNVPGVLALRCELALRSRKSMQSCEQALKAQPDNLQATYLLGVSAMQRHQPRVAAGYFERVVELEPSFADGWRQLTASYQAAGDRKGLERLRSLGR